MAANQNRISLQRMRELIDLLGAADIAYYRDDNPSMTDREYDAYTEELQWLINFRVHADAFPKKQKENFGCQERLFPWTNSNPEQNF